ncbi:MAG TPA: sigma-70 family RNA polymerase sigma factor [Bryobacteraceae bacterium]|nr:sigma-70 family RNA polymerase sigma factor [Bryobacteraceae bacterium]
MADAAPQDVTRLLERWSSGDKNALDELTPLVYYELRKVARRQMMRERAEHTLEATALVHEAYLRLVGQKGSKWQSRAHFFAVAAEMARRILVDHAKARNAKKRGGPKISLDDSPEPYVQQDADVIAINDALEELAKLDPRQAKIVELRYFAGLTIEETAEVMGISTPTVKRDWLVARAFLQRSLSNTVT